MFDTKLNVLHVFFAVRVLFLVATFCHSEAGTFGARARTQENEESAAGV